MFNNISIILGRYFQEANRIVRKSMKIKRNKFDSLNLFYNLIEVSNLLLSCFQMFLLASVTAQFILSLSLFYNLFLNINGHIKFSAFVVISTILWIVYQFSLLTSYIRGCNHIHAKIDVLWNFNARKIRMIGNFAEVRFFTCENGKIFLVLFSSWKTCNCW